MMECDFPVVARRQSVPVAGGADGMRLSVVARR